MTDHVAEGDVTEAAEATADVSALTPPELEVNKASDDLKVVFGITGITRVVSVDDGYQGDLPQLLTLGEVGSAARLKDFAGRFDLTVEEEFWRAQMRDFWEAAEPDERRRVLAAAQRESGDKDNDASQLDISHLFPLIEGTGVAFEAVPPDEWPAMQRDVVTGAADTPTLILFDRDLGDHGDEGIAMAAKVFQADAHGKVYVALLTRTIDSSGEVETWRKLTDANPRLKRDRFVVISKERLGPNPDAFPNAIKTVLMAKPASYLRAAVSQSVKAARKTAADELAKISPEDFQRMIIVSSANEGVWEPESLLRVFQLLMARRVRDELYSVEEVKESAAELRRLWALSTLQRSESPMARELAHAEYYEDANFINQMHMPVELGDIFDVKGREYVLLEQPCDLMVRGNGERAPELHDCTLVLITDTKPRAAAVGYELPFYGEDGKPAWVNLKSTITAPMRAVDYTVFSDEGKSVFDVSSAEHLSLWPAWEARRRKLGSKAQTIIDQVEALKLLASKSQLSKTMETALTQRVMHTDKASGRAIAGFVDGTEVRYELQRVGRMRPSLCRSLLLQFSLFRAREATDYPLALGG